MNSKEQILNNIRQHNLEQYDMPVIELDAIQFPDKINQFIEVSKAVGGNVS